MMDVREKPTLHHQPHNVRNLLVRRSNHSGLDLLLLALIPFNDNIHILMQSDVHDGCLLLFFIKLQCIKANFYHVSFIRLLELHCGQVCSQELLFVLYEIFPPFQALEENSMSVVSRQMALLF